MAAQADKAKAETGGVRRAVEAVLSRHAFTPLGGLVGEPLVNVFEVNLAVRDEVKALAGR